MWAAYTKAIAELKAAKREHQGLGWDDLLGCTQEHDACDCDDRDGWPTRDTMEADIAMACVALGNAEEPAVRYFHRRPGDETIIATLDGIAASCFQ
ncbi:MAG: hypothetical protein NTX42_07895 [Methanothrix sp.]|nr:hypothetical protein [Methanothrix sp.]